MLLAHGLDWIAPKPPKDSSPPLSVLSSQSQLSASRSGPAVRLGSDSQIHSHSRAALFVEPEDDEAAADCDGGGADVAEADPLGGRASDPMDAAPADSHSERPEAEHELDAEAEAEADDEPAFEFAVEQPAAESESTGDDV